MSVAFRPARRDDVPAIIALLRDDALGAPREGEDLAPYLAAFDAMEAEGGNLTIVGEDAGRIIATYQVSFITGLSLRAMRRANVESVRVATDRRREGLGRAMFADIEARARAAGCGMIQLAMNATRTETFKFYEGVGYTPSHVGWKRMLD